MLGARIARAGDAKRVEAEQRAAEVAEKLTTLEARLGEGRAVILHCHSLSQ
jgi:hypothetical protein